MNAASPAPRPAFVFMVMVILVVNVGAYLVREFTRHHVSTSEMIQMIEMIDWGANIAPLTLTQSPSRLLTSMFLHAGLLHLGLNMTMLLVLGGVAERAFVTVRFTLIYLLAGLFSGLLSALWYGRRMLVDVLVVNGDVIKKEQLELVLSMGASGALMGIAGACLARSLIVGDGERDAESQRMRAPLLQTIGLTLVMGALLPGVDNAAHIGGLLAGGLLGGLLTLASRSRQPVSRALATAFLCGACGFILATALRTEPTPELLTLKAELIDEIHVALNGETWTID